MIFQECVALGSDPDGCLTGLSPTWPVTVYTDTVEAGTWLTFSLESDDALVPRLDGELLHLLVLADLLPLPSGANQVNAGAALTVTDPFGMDWQAQAGPVDVEAHGAFVQATYQALSITNSCDAGYLVLLEENQALIEAVAHNYGDRKAETVRLTLTLPISIEILTVGPGAVISRQQIVWGGFDLAPGGWSEPITFVLSAWPPLPAVGTEQTVVQSAWAAFWDEYSAQTVTGLAAGRYALPVGLPPRFVYRLYLPVTLRDYQHDWWPDPRPDQPDQGGTP